MRISVITPSFNSGSYIEATLSSVLAQRQAGGPEIEHIVVDGGSTDDTPAILERHRRQLSRLIIEPDGGPAEAINKGLHLATGDVLAWLNADDLYHAGALARVAAAIGRHPPRALCFGRCRIIDGEGREIRRGVTRFKNACHPFSCRPLIQTVNYVSQPALFFTRNAWRLAGDLRTDLSAAFDYEFLLRLWRHGGALRLGGAPLADFRRHATSISTRSFELQFREEWEAAAADSGRFSPQALAHALVRHGIVAAYRRMEGEPHEEERPQA